MTTLAGRYRLEDVIGRGGMSTVYRATDRILQRTVAVKVMSAALAELDPSYVARFEREARAAASLAHPGIVTVYDTGVDGDHRFIAMEYVDGESLDKVIAEEAPLDPARAAGIAAAVADALEAAHHAGLVHRDVKPGNVMIARNGSVKVLDFGIARVADAGSITATASLLGTAAYMAPEHALGTPVDARSDVYSLGCVLYAMLTGGPPFTGEPVAAVLHQQVNATPRPPGEANSRVGAGLDALVLGMLAKSPEDRPQSAAEVRDRLRGAPAPPPRGAAAAPVPTASTRAQPTAATRAIGGSPRRSGPPVGAAGGGPGRDGWIRYLVGALAIALVALIAALALASGGGQSTSTSSSTAAPPSRSTSTPTAPAHTSTSTATAPPKTVTVTTPASTTTPPAPAGTPTPPGLGGVPPGQAKKAHGKHAGGG